jgi:hypothetical protein
MSPGQIVGCLMGVRVAAQTFVIEHDVPSTLTLDDGKYPRFGLEVVHV